MASVCVGAHTLAAAGLLDGKHTTTHWSTAAQLAAEYPSITVDADPIFIRDGNVWTGAGLSACIDLSLALLADDFGEALALRIARQLVPYLKRPSGQSQFSVRLDAVSQTRRVEELRHYITRRLADPLTVADLAAQACVSEHQLSRIIKQELGLHRRPIWSRPASRWPAIAWRPPTTPRPHRDRLRLQHHRHPTDPGR
jgi:transcriptional regulator GlxA family with amidase domain